MELGIYSFGEMGVDPVSGQRISGEQRMQQLLEEIRLTEQVGLDVYAIGEHHRRDYLVSAPAVVLAAAAAQTEKIRLSSAVTVLSSDDPVRVFQQFATVDLISKGRAEIMAGRGSFIESFPLFGYNLDDYDALFAEKLGLLLEISKQEVINWKGEFRAPIRNQPVYPRPAQTQLPVWVAIGGTPESVIRAGKLGLPMALAIIGGMPARFAGLTDLYKKTYTAAGHTQPWQLGINGHVYVADNSQQAADEFYPSYAEVMSRIGRERGWPALNREQYEAMRSPKASLMVGSPQEVIDKMLYQYELFGNTRFMAQMTVGPIAHKQVLRSIELFGTMVAPVVRQHVAAKQATKA
ncbi:MAG: LLM class flavin-dependent oxidoreductase [Sphingobacteriales bacterium]|nr:LLM class flavin-dependent oxidoreductase [Sphingobacteriales bacterium]OJW30312.1 MAG: luciferase [Sphingobacteriales bacterium 46-32]